MSATLNEIARDLTIALINAKTSTFQANVNDPRVLATFAGRMYRQILKEVYAADDEPRGDVPAV